MSLTALDTDQLPRYFAAREHSAVGLGRMVPDASGATPEQQADREAAFKAIKIATQGLVRSGAIERLQRGRNGHRAEYALSFRGTENAPLESTETVPLRGTKSVPLGGLNPSPQGTTEEPLEELPRRTGRFTQAPYLEPVDNDERKTA
jgi:hypothetical protein